MTNNTYLTILIRFLITGDCVTLENESEYDIWLILKATDLSQLTAEAQASLHIDTVLPEAWLLTHTAEEIHVCKMVKEASVIWSCHNDPKFSDRQV